MAILVAMATLVRNVNCPVCGKPVPWTPESAYRPFCSERCKKIDLGAWASGEYKLPGASSEPGAADGGDAVGPGGEG
jgi:uncharacterized protein